MQVGDVDLVRHPVAPWPGPELAITAACNVRDDDFFVWCFTVAGDVGGIVWPAPASNVRVDGLWRHTCFEVFVGHAGMGSYFEFNLAPSGAWAAYAFAGYRAPAEPPRVPTPAISATRGDCRLSLTAVIDPRPWLAQGAATTLEVGLSAVLEHQSGGLGYFALHHPGERPDFHDRRGFVLRVEPERQAESAARERRQ